MAGGHAVLEIGPGTGEIGAHVARAVTGYLGLDASRPMLERFGARGSPALLAQADAARPWPVRAHSVGLVFASRAVHLLDRRHVAAEVGRVLEVGGLVVLGRIQRPPDGLRNRLRDRRRTLLAEHGVVLGGDGAEKGRKLLDDLARMGATRLPTHVAARWTVETDPAHVIANWRTGGRPTPEAVLDELAAWAPRQPETEEERYELDAVRIP